MAIIDKSNRNYTHKLKPRYFSDNYAASVCSDSSLKVVSFNINFSRKIDEAISLFQLSSPLQNADIICLQEMSHAGVEKISRILKYSYVYYPAVKHPLHNRDFGNAILTRHNIVEDFKIHLPSSSPKHLQRIATGIVIETAAGKVSVINLHMKLFIKSFYRVKHIKDIIESCFEISDKTVIAGDFNSFNPKVRKQVDKTFKENNFSCATRGVGWTCHPCNIKFFKITVDYIYTKGFGVEEAGKVSEPLVSDHLPVWVKLKT